MLLFERYVEFVEKTLEDINEIYMQMNELELKVAHCLFLIWC